jgi:hypothetical protein
MFSGTSSSFETRHPAPHMTEDAPPSAQRPRHLAEEDVHIAIPPSIIAVCLNISVIGRSIVVAAGGGSA